MPQGACMFGSAYLKAEDMPCRPHCSNVRVLCEDLVQYRAMVLAIRVSVEIELEQVLQLERLSRDRVPVKFAYIWHDMLDVIHNAI